MSDAPDDRRAARIFNEYYHGLLDVVPREVAELAAFLRRIAFLDATERATVIDDPLDGSSWGYEPEPYLNWFGAARRNLVPGMPAWRWRRIIEEVQARFHDPKWREVIPVDNNTPEGAGLVSWDVDGRGQSCADWLLDQCAEFIRRFLQAPRPIPFERAQALTPRLWEVAVLVCNRRLDVPEAAQELGIEPTTTRKYLEDAAKALDVSVKELRRRSIETLPPSARGG